MPKPPNWTERRQYFRVEDQVRLRISPLTPEESQEHLRVMGTPSHLVTLLAPLRQRFGQVLRTLAVESPGAAEGLKLLDEKIEVLARWLDGGQDSHEMPLCQVSLSARGLACDSTVFFPIRSHLEMCLVLWPNLWLIRTVAKVVACDPLPASAQTYRLRMVFLGLAEADQEFLIRHVLQRQGERLRHQPKSPAKYS